MIKYYIEHKLLTQEKKYRIKENNNIDVHVSHEHKFLAFFTRLSLNLPFSSILVVYMPWWYLSLSWLHQLNFYSCYPALLVKEILNGCMFNFTLILLVIHMGHAI